VQLGGRKGADVLWPGSCSKLLRQLTGSRPKLFSNSAGKGASVEMLDVIFARRRGNQLQHAGLS
jgi:hypothetical protein